MKYYFLFLLKTRKDGAKFVVWCSRDWCFKVNTCFGCLKESSMSLRWFFRVPTTYIFWLINKNLFLITHSHPET